MAKKDVNQKFKDFLASEVPREGGDKSFLITSKFAKETGLNPKAVYRNLSPAACYEHALKYEPGTHITSSGAMAATSGKKTGRSPKDKRVVCEEASQGEVWRGTGSPNYEMDDKTFLMNRATAVDYLNSVSRVYVVDAFAGWDPKYRQKIRVICTRAYHALFMWNMLIRPTDAEVASFGEPDFVIYNAGCASANRYAPYSANSTTSIDVCLNRKEMVILGSQYAGEMKKGVFSVMNYLMPKTGVLSLHSGCNEGAKGDTTLFFGLSGTGKTTLSTDAARPLIGDDEHCWGDNGVFNIEGGCYAKCINLKQTSEPEIWKAIRYGTILENVVFDPATRIVDYDSDLLTENTRACYPIEAIDNSKRPCVGGHPKNIIMLTCDVFGVLPPVSKLTPEQAMYHFIAGYTSKMAGTEMGVTKPETTFSACYGAAFLMWHPYKYAGMLAEKVKQHGTQCWLINTGWCNGPYGVGRRISIKHTRALIDAIHSGELATAPLQAVKYFDLHFPTKCGDVPPEILNPASGWKSKAAYDAKLADLACRFLKAMEKFKDGEKYVGVEMAERIASGGPKLPPKWLRRLKSSAKLAGRLSLVAAVVVGVISAVRK